MNITSNDFEDEVQFDGFFKNKSAVSVVGNRRVSQNYNCPKVQLNGRRSKILHLIFLVSIDGGFLALVFIFVFLLLCMV